MTTERLKYIFDQVTDTECLVDCYATPWIYENRIFATNCQLILCLKITEDRVNAFQDNGAVHPNVKGFIPPFDITFKTAHYVNVDALESFEGHCELAGTSVSDRNARNIAKVLRLFGMEVAVFSKTDHNRLLFEITDSDGISGMLLCIDSAKETNVTLLFHDTDLDPSAARLYDAMVNDTRGEDYYKKCLERDKADQEQYDKENFTVYKVTLVRSKTVCVKADSEQEARGIALDNACYLDFDDPCEIENCEESCKYDCCDIYKKYFDESGRHEWETAGQ